MLALVRQLEAAVGAEHCHAPAPEGSDWLGRSRPPGAARVAPASAEEVAEVLRACTAAQVPVVPIGGDTGLVAGTLPDADDQPVVELSTRRLRGLEVDAAAGVLLAGAGETLAAVQAAAAGAGWSYGVDLAARDSATIGGTVATNAGGIHVCAYGTTRAQLLGVEAVLADGAVVRDLRGLPKDNTGLDLRDLLCGSEGTLAVVTRVLLRLHPPPERLACLVAEVPDLAAGLAFSQRVEPAGRVRACEFVDAVSWRDAAAGIGLRDPVRPGVAGFVVLVELMDCDEDVLTAVAPPECVVATEAPARRALWAVREQQSEWWIRRRVAGGQLVKFDVALPLPQLDDALRHVVDRFAGDPAVTGWGVFGHLREGSLHLQAVVAATEAAEVEQDTYRLVARLGGSISAEHGIGRDKAGLLGLVRSDAERAAGRAIKAALDPRGTLNPGVIFGAG